MFWVPGSEQYHLRGVQAERRGHSETTEQPEDNDEDRSDTLGTQCVTVEGKEGVRKGKHLGHHPAHHSLGYASMYEGHSHSATRTTGFMGVVHSIPPSDGNVLGPPGRGTSGPKGGDVSGLPSHVRDLAPRNGCPNEWMGAGRPRAYCAFVRVGTPHGLEVARWQPEATGP